MLINIFLYINYISIHKNYITFIIYFYIRNKSQEKINLKKKLKKILI